MRNYYIVKSGRLKREANSLMFEYFEKDETQTDEENIETRANVKRVPVPIETIDCVYVFGEVDFNTKLINFFSQKNIIIHFFNYYGYYTGSFYPKEFLLSGEILVKQSEHYLDSEKRLELAKEFIRGASYGTIQNLKRYKEKTGDILARVENLNESLYNNSINTISGLMGIEGNIKEAYYKAFPLIINQKIDFTKRVKHPPDNMMNALISFVNSMIYTQTLKEIYKSQLNPTVSFLHEPFYRRFSLALDIAEIFKPIYGDRVIFDLLNNNMLKKEHFDKDLNYAYLKEDGKKIVIKAMEEKLDTTITHKKLNKKVSYRSIIRYEAYKLVKHFLGEEEYKSFRIWW